MKRFIEDLETHQDEVADLMLSFGMALGLDDETLNKCYHAGKKHDCGKVDVDLKVLQKPSKLTETEMEIIKRHVEYGVKRLEGWDPEIIRAIHEHHENYDGSGYPKKLSGDEISLIGRLLRISDVYIALRRQRVYKRAFAHQNAISIMQSECKNYDPELFDEFKQYIDVNENKIKKYNSQKSLIGRSRAT